MQPTISDVATMAGVSAATVSRALNGKSTVAPELAARVLAAAGELSYRPNGPARNLRKQAAAVLALIISDVENPFFTAVARGVEDVAQAAGFSVVLCNSDDDSDKEREYVEVAIQERVAGVLLSSTGCGSSADRLRAGKTPMVAIDRPLPCFLGDTVLVDNRLAAGQATTHLMEQGYRRIGCLTGPSGVLTADDRLAGYRDALRAARRPTPETLVGRTGFKATGAKQAAHRLLTQPGPPDALLVASNAMAVGVLQAFGELGLRAGRDVGLICFDDAPWTTLVDPPLTVVAQPAYDIGKIAARLLLDRFGESHTEGTTTTLTARLVVRGSSSR